MKTYHPINKSSHVDLGFLLVSSSFFDHYKIDKFSELVFYILGWNLSLYGQYSVFQEDACTYIYIYIDSFSNMHAHSNVFLLDFTSNPIYS